MICPNDNQEMRQVKIISHYGQPIFLDQCGSFGGLWFDETKLYRGKPGEAEKIELADADILRQPTLIMNPTHFCPRDKTALIKFSDANFPKEVILERCPNCGGFWLNRGEFTKYQKARQELLRPREKTSEDIELENNLKQLAASYREGTDDNRLKKLASFLSKPVDADNLLLAEPVSQITENKNPLGYLMDVLMLLLRFFVFKG